MGSAKNQKCIKCGEIAEVKYRNDWFCGPCLNPEPTIDYLREERERVNGQWGGIRVEMWDRM
jgi:hypothetical protein